MGSFSKVSSCEERSSKDQRGENWLARKGPRVDEEEGSRPR